MPIRFSTQAANADHMGADPEPSGPPPGLPDAVNTVGTPRGRASRGASRHAPGAAGRRDADTAAKPGKDINAPGFIKDKDDTPS